MKRHDQIKNENSKIKNRFLETNNYAPIKL